MKETLGLIPQVFYDLIGRVAPGAALLISGFMLLGDHPVDAIGRFLHPASAALLSILFVLFILAAYLVGLVLGAAAFVFEDRTAGRKFENVERRHPSDPIQESDIPFAYDYIIAHDASAGVRLVKLRAETHLCHVLIVGSPMLAVLYLSKHYTDLVYHVVAITLAHIVVVLLALSFRQHLQIRIWRLVVNSWTILNDRTKEERPAPNIDVSTQDHLSVQRHSAVPMPTSPSPAATTQATVPRSTD